VTLRNDTLSSFFLPISPLLPLWFCLFSFSPGSGFKDLVGTIFFRVQGIASRLPPWTERMTLPPDGAQASPPPLDAHFFPLIVQLAVRSDNRVPFFGESLSRRCTSFTGNIHPRSFLKSEFTSFRAFLFLSYTTRMLLPDHPASIAYPTRSFAFVEWSLSERGRSNRTLLAFLLGLSPNFISLVPLFGRPISSTTFTHMAFSARTFVPLIPEGNAQRLLSALYFLYESPSVPLLHLLPFLPSLAESVEPLISPRTRRITQQQTLLPLTLSIKPFQNN